MRPSVASASIVSTLPALAARGERDARELRLAVDQHRAGAAFAAVAAALGAGEPQRLAQIVEQQRVIRDRILAVPAVDRQGKDALGHVFSDRPRLRTWCGRGPMSLRAHAANRQVRERESLVEPGAGDRA